MAGVPGVDFCERCGGGLEWPQFPTHCGGQPCPVCEGMCMCPYYESLERVDKDENQE